MLVVKKIIILFVIIAMNILPAFAAPTDIYQFDSTHQQRQFQKLSREFRCLVCQNESLADSNAPLALDLRYQIYKMVKQDKSNQDIINFLVNRYGDFVIFQPPFSRYTFLLWVGPFIMLAIALFRLYFVVTNQRSKRPKKTRFPKEGRKRIRYLLRQL